MKLLWINSCIVCKCTQAEFACQESCLFTSPPSVDFTKRWVTVGNLHDLIVFENLWSVSLHVSCPYIVYYLQISSPSTVNLILWTATRCRATYPPWCWSSCIIITISGQQLSQLIADAGFFPQVVAALRFALRFLQLCRVITHPTYIYQQCRQS